MTAPAGYTLINSEGFAATIPIVESLCHLDYGQIGTTACCTMAVITRRLRGAIESIVVLFHPRLTETVHAMGPTIYSSRHARVADCTLTDRGGISLAFNGLQVVVYLVAADTGFIGVFSMS